MHLSLSVMGLFLGALVGLTGVGAASLLTPVLVFIGIHPSVAIGSDLVFNAITKLFGVIQHNRQKTIDYQMVGKLALGSIPGAIIAVVGLHIFHGAYKHEETLIKQILGSVLMVASLATLIRIFFGRQLNQSHLNKWGENRWLAPVIGLVFGFFVGITSIGSGALFALAMMYLYQFSGAKLVGTDIAHAFMLSSVAGLLNVGFGHVDYALVCNLLLGSIPGIFIGSYLSTKIPSRPLRLIMAILVFASGIKLV